MSIEVLMMKPIANAAIAIAMAGLLGMPAAAAVKVATYSGTVDFGFSAGIFGPDPTRFINIAGYTYVATFIYDTDLGQRSGNGLFGYEDVRGGTSLGIVSPFISATLSLTGLEFTNSSTSLLGAELGYATAYFTSSGHGASDDSQNKFSVFARNFILGTDIDANLATTPFSNGGGQFNFARPYGIGQQTALGTFAPSGTIEITDLTSPGGVPEPASWAMLIGGFAAVGLQARRRGRRLLAATA